MTLNRKKVQEKPKNTIKVIVWSVIIGLILAGGSMYLIWTLIENQGEAINCNELYSNLDSCELYKCRAENSNWLPNMEFNIRNYEMCKIILNNNMSFNESLDLLNTIYPER